MELILCNGAVPGCISTVRPTNTDAAFNDLIMRSKQCMSYMLNFLFPHEHIEYKLLFILYVMSDKTQSDFLLGLEPCWLKDTYSDGGNDFHLKHNYLTSSVCSSNMDY